MSKLQTIVGAAIAIAFFIIIAALTRARPESWNDMSRVAAIESLAERGTWAIDNASWEDQTQDKIFLSGKFYSDKMPLMSLVGAGLYRIMYMFDGSLAVDCGQASRFCAYYWLTLILVGLPAALLLWLFLNFGLQRSITLWAGLIGTAALGIGTMIFPYALVLNHHVPAAVSLFASFYLLSGFSNPRQHGNAAQHRLLAAGFFAALAISFDALAGIIAASLFAIALVRARRQAIFFALGAALPIFATAALDYHIAQTIIPPYMIASAYDYPGSAFPATIGGNGTPDDYAAYAFRMFLGGKGLFAYNPLLVLALIGAIAVALNRRHSLWVESLSVTAGFVLLSVYLATQTGNFGGTAYGERWFIPAIPMLFGFIFFAPPLNAENWRNFAWIIFAPLLALSIFSSLQGAQAPWQDALPPLQMTRSEQFPILGFKWNVR